MGNRRFFSRIVPAGSAFSRNKLSEHRPIHFRLELLLSHNLDRGSDSKLRTILRWPVSLSIRRSTAVDRTGSRVSSKIRRAGEKDHRRRFGPRIKKRVQKSTQSRRASLHSRTDSWILYLGNRRPSKSAGLQLSSG